MKRILLLTLALAGTLAADVRLPALLSDHMLLQRDAPLRLWGWASPGETVSVTLLGQTSTAAATPEGKWEVYFTPIHAQATPTSITVKGNNQITIQDVLVGDVWVGSGQSNMAWTVKNSNNPETEIAAAQYPQIRIFQVALKTSETPLDDVTGKWALVTPESIPNFSAVGYFFSRELHKHLKTPIGFIQSAWGGTPVQAWTRLSLMESDLSMNWVLANWREYVSRYPAAKVRHDKAVAEWEAKGRQGSRPAGPLGPGHAHTPGGLYNAMIVPLLPYAIKGAIWYQGESNAGGKTANQYRHQFVEMIRDWRAQWGVGNFPFLYVQLANWAPGNASGWPLVQEAQDKTLDLRGTGMAVITDIGEEKDIHPRNKQDVGARLALAARHVAHGEEIVYSGPRYRQVTREGSSLRVWLDHSGRGLVAKGGGEPRGFFVAGADRAFFRATARIDGKTVVVSSPEVSNPVAVRYNWAPFPNGNLFNADGLPASLFRSDDWDDVTMPPVN
ncbi:MAG: sialate O-acetylesterase [Bryobacterales bacterium]|nr:sialate O-acetylesterase [Bryobacterales bacterium]